MINPASPESTGVLDRSLEGEVVGQFALTHGVREAFVGLLGADAPVEADLRAAREALRSSDISRRLRSALPAG